MPKIFITPQFPPDRFVEGDSVIHARFGKGHVAERSYDNCISETEWLYLIHFEDDQIIGEILSHELERPEPSFEEKMAACMVDV
jgi:hypothetical protein